MKRKAGGVIDIGRRLIGASAIISSNKHDVADVDLDGLVRRLLLFDKYVLVSVRLGEFPISARRLTHVRMGTRYQPKDSAGRHRRHTMVLTVLYRTDVGILRLRRHFALRSVCCAQDDSGESLEGGPLADATGRMHRSFALLRMTARTYVVKFLGATFGSAHRIFCGALLRWRAGAVPTLAVYAGFRGRAPAPDKSLFRGSEQVSGWLFSGVLPAQRNSRSFDSA